MRLDISNSEHPFDMCLISIIAQGSASDTTHLFNHLKFPSRKGGLNWEEENGDPKRSDWNPLWKFESFY